MQRSTTCVAQRIFKLVIPEPGALTIVWALTHLGWALRIPLDRCTLVDPLGTLGARYAYTCQTCGVCVCVHTVRHLHTYMRTNMCAQVLGAFPQASKHVFNDVVGESGPTRSSRGLFGICPFGVFLADSQQPPSFTNGSSKGQAVTSNSDPEENSNCLLSSCLLSSCTSPISFSLTSPLQTSPDLPLSRRPARRSGPSAMTSPGLASPRSPRSPRSPSPRAPPEVKPLFSASSDHRCRAGCSGRKTSKESKGHKAA